MKILVDENMPYAVPLFGRLGEVHPVSGRQLSALELNDADALMVRSVTNVNSSLLAATPVSFVGSATAGTDHVDRQWLEQQNIAFSSAPGCNAIAVVEYVISSLLFLAERDGFQLKDKTVGIIGVGNVGSRLNDRLATLGVKTLLCDPPRAERGDKEAFYPLEKLMRSADILSFHTPLYESGLYKTYHMIDTAMLAKIPDGRIIINASRGEVIDNLALLFALESGRDFRVILDVWEPEPELLQPLLSRADIGTPHIAGYSLEGKARGTTQIYHAFSQHIGQPDRVELASLLPIADFNRVTFYGELDQSKLKRLVHLVYDVRRDDALLRQVANTNGGFDGIRKNYPERREWSSLTVVCDNPQTASILDKLGFNAELA